MSEGSRPRKRNGLPSKWAEVVRLVYPAELKAIWEQETVFSDDALTLAAELLVIPTEAALRGYEIEPAFRQDTFKDASSEGFSFSQQDPLVGLL